jgi:4Fe-4S ferredoxin
MTMADMQNPGAVCRSKAEPGTALPVIDRNRCEGERNCFDVCPYDVFEVRPLRKDERTDMTFVGRLKSRAHGWQQAIVERPADCHACGLCVKACPEKAITLTKL